MAIVMNVGPSMSGGGAAGSSGATGGGQTLGNAQGNITINVRNVTQANTILQNSAKEMAKAFADVGRAAQESAKIQIAESRAAVAASKAIMAQQNQQAQASKQASMQQAQDAKTRATATKSAADQIISSHKVLEAAERQRHQASVQQTQQQIASQRLLVAQANAQSAQHREVAAAARANGVAQKQAADASKTGWQRVTDSVGKLRTEILALGAGAGILSGLGLKYAGFIQESRVQLEAMTGTQEKANTLMEELRQKGSQARIPLREMLTFATQLLPVLEKDTDELHRWFDVVRRTAILNRGPMGGLQGAAFSLREAFLSVQQGGRDFVSLADRFNISKVALREALEVSGGDFINAIDLVLNKMGITTETADRMAQTFNSGLILARDAALQLLGEGFTPLLSILGPMLQKSADFMSMISQTNPEVLILGSSLLVLVTVGSGVILMLERMTVAWAALGITAQATIARMLGIAGLSLVAVAAVRPAGEALGNFQRTAFAGKEALTREEMDEEYRKRIFDFVTHLANAGQIMVDAIFSTSAAIWDFTASVNEATSSIFTALANISFGDLSERFTAASTTSSLDAGRARLNASRARQEGRDARAGIWDWAASIGRNLGIEGFEAPSVEFNAGETEEQANVRRIKAEMEFSRAVEDLEESSHRQRLQAGQEYNNQVRNTTENYNKGRLREAEDFARQRARQEEQLVNDIIDVREEASRREAEWMEDLERSRGKMLEDFNEKEEEQREDHNDKLAELEEDYRDKREKDLRSHMDRLLSAASQLDARGIYEEQRRFQRQQEEAKKEFEKRVKDEIKDFSERRQKEKEDFDERLKDEEENLQIRLRRSREADERRIKDMEESFAEQKRIEDEDRAIRLSRQEADFQDQLTQMAEQHSLRMAEINRQEFQKLKSLKDNLSDELEELGFYHAARKLAEELFYEKSLERWGEFFDDWVEADQLARKKARLQDPIPSSIKSDSPIIPFQAGGPVLKDTRAVLHKGEFVLNPNTTNVLRDMLSGGRMFTQQGLISSVSNNSKSTSIIVSPQAIQVFAAAGQSEREVAMQVRHQFANLLREVRG